MIQFIAKNNYIFVIKVTRAG